MNATIYLRNFRYFNFPLKTLWYYSAALFACWMFGLMASLEQDLRWNFEACKFFWHTLWIHTMKLLVLLFWQLLIHGSATTGFPCGSLYQPINSWAISVSLPAGWSPAVAPMYSERSLSETCWLGRGFLKIWRAREYHLEKCCPQRGTPPTNTHTHHYEGKWILVQG